MAVAYKEIIDSQSPATVGFSHDGGRASTLYLCTSEDLVDSLQDLLGKTEKGGNGALHRTLPRAHPRFPWLFVERISNIQGVGRMTKVGSADSLEADPIDFGASYTQYRITVEFAPQPYAFVTDDHVVVTDIDWYDDNNNLTSGVYAPEWTRFTTYEEIPSTELITFQQGSMVLHRGDADPPNLYTFPGPQNMVVPRSQILLTWHRVPYDFVTNSLGAIKKYLGRINQTEFYGFPAGSLLYGTSPRVKIYTPPWPEETTIPGGGVTYFDKRCDITFIFDYVDRTTPSAPTPANRNWIAAGHNLLPWAGDRKFYYGTARKQGDLANTAYWYPSFKSFPFQFLFTEPIFID